MMEKITAENIMTQQVLGEIRALCTQEEPPACSATCPLHVDARLFLHALAEGDHKAAYTAYAKKVPFPELLSYLCEAPCQAVCRRSEAGGAVEIHEIERYLFKTEGKPQRIPPFFPKAKGRIAIVGGGLRGMTAALELAKKGYEVTLYEKESQLGGSLNQLTEDACPQEVLLRAVDYLGQFPLTIQLNHEEMITSLEQAATAQKKLQVDALYLAFENPLYQQADSFTGQLKDYPIFTGTRIPTKKSHIITKMYDGKTMAITIDRAVPQVALLAGREKEAPFETKLFTNIENIAHTLPTSKAEMEYNQEEAVAEAKRCIQCECLECVKGCKYMAQHKTYPLQLSREIFNNLTIAMGIRHANKLIGTCNLCGQCGAICPNGLSMEPMVLAARQRMVQQSIMPPSYHDFALSDMEYSNGPSSLLVRNEPGHSSSRYIYFPSCQLAASEPALIKASYAELCKSLTGGVGLFLGCCGIMAHWAGQEDLFLSTLETIAQELGKLGNPQIITACPSCKHTLSHYGNFHTVGIWEVLAEHPQENPVTQKGETFFIQDACGARNDKKTQLQIRKILTEAGYDIQEPTYTKEKSACCGYGGLTPFVNQDLADEISRFATENTKQNSISYCINCRDRFLKTGGESFHLLELLYGHGLSLNHKYPTLSQRQENRKQLKNELLTQLWNETVVEETILNLLITKELEEALEKRMILKSEIQRVIEVSEETGAYFRDRKTNNLIASMRLGNVTFWVNFTKNDGSYTIHNAYSHRMEIVE